MTHWMEGDYPGEDPVFVDVRKLIEVARKVANGNTSDDYLAALEDAIEAVELHTEDDDPKSMWLRSPVIANPTHNVSDNPVCGPTQRRLNR